MVRSRLLSLLAVCLPLATSAAATEIFASAADVAPLLTTSGAPGLFEVAPPSEFDGVAKLIINYRSAANPRSVLSLGCSGALMSGGLHLLTAAHCLSADPNSLEFDSLTATVYTAAGAQSFSAAKVFVHPDWDGEILNGNDIAVVRLKQAAGVVGYDLFRNIDFTGVALMAGFGDSGRGVDDPALPFGKLRAGRNLFDAVWTIAGAPFAFDFDNGRAANDTIGLVAGITNRGITREVMTAPGDSGGPSFFWNPAARAYQIGGVHSFLAHLRDPETGRVIGDVDSTLNSSYGELGGDTRVAAYADWIDSVTIPEPAAVWMAAAGLVGIVVAARRRRRG